MDKFKIFGLTGTSTQAAVPEVAKFPGGEIRVRIPGTATSGWITLEAVLLNSDDVMTLVMLTDALRRMGAKQIDLNMPYIPYARQDRVCNHGEALSVAAFADIINSLEFNSVTVWDPHSDVAPALIHNCIVKSRTELMRAHDDVYAFICRGGWDKDPLYLVSPDAGAVKKSYEIVKAFPQFNGIIFAEKVRDVKTGNILRTTVSQPPEDFGRAQLLVCDDICDGGRTFTELAKVLEPYGPKGMSLYVTHGIFSQGKEVLLNKKTEPAWDGESYRVEHTGKFDNVWCSLDFTEFQK